MARYKRLPVGDVLVDERYQRPLDEARVGRIADNFDERLFGALDVSVRNGKVAVFDGQHRLAVAKTLGHETVPCLVHANLSPQDEANLFVELQRQRKGIQPVDRFRARVFAGEPNAVAINEIVERRGFRIRQGSSYDNGAQRNIAAVGALDRIYATGALDETLVLLEDVWGGDPKSTDGWLVEGLSIIVAGYGHRLGAREIDKLRQIPPATILRRVAGRRQTFGGNEGTRAKTVAAELRKTLGLRGTPRKKKASARG